MRWFVFFIIIISFTQVVLAADSTFRVRTLVGGDTTPPSTPTNLVALPISTSQIDLTWNASTDNYIFGGYQVWRDAVQLATTTLTNYSDTGLSASTTYSYYIVAFDNALNYSSSSSVVATSTLPIVATSTPTTTIPVSEDVNSGTQSSKAVMAIKNLVIDTTETTAYIKLDNTTYSKVTWRWGQTINYESGYIASDIYRQSHQTTLTELKPGNIYELEIILTRRLTGETLIHKVQFETKSPLDNLAPPNVGDLSAKVLNNGQIDLSWTNPEIDDLAYVRVLSNDYFYPLDRVDGWFVYEGKGQRVIDDRLIKSNRYYTVFVYDTSGNRSSGAIIYVPYDFGVGEGITSVDIISPVTDYYPYNKFDFSKLEVYQNNQLLPQFDGTFTIERQRPVTFKLPYGDLPENLKTVILTLTSPHDKSKKFSFLLVINRDRTAYEATISELLELGYYETTISIYDYSARVVLEKTGGLIVSDRYFDDKVVKVIEEIKLLVNWTLIIIVLAILASLGVFFLWRFFTRR